MDIHTSSFPIFASASRTSLFMFPFCLTFEPPKFAKAQSSSAKLAFSIYEVTAIRNVDIVKLKLNPQPF